MSKFKAFVWILFITASALALSSAAIYYIGYGLFIPHSGTVYSGMTLFWHKALLVSSLISFGLFFAHGSIAGLALWRKNYPRVAQVSLATLVMLGLFLVVHLIHS